MRIILIRHTSVAITSKYCYGISDVELADTWQQEMATIATKIAEIRQKNAKTSVFSSPLSRCKRLAEYLFKGSENENIVFDNRLLELNFGDWEMIPWADLPPEAFNVWMSDFTNIPTPNGESFRDLNLRTADFLKSLEQQATKKDDKNESEAIVFVVCHAGVIRSILCHALGIPPENAFRIGLEYGAIAQMRWLYGAWQVSAIG